MATTHFLMIGGFLGAGKTTAIARLARHYTEQGLRVGIVTNDQAFGLVDTHSLRAKGFDVREVPGACFCCKFEELVETAAQLGAEHQPDILLTEPVGSCTDLVATVLRPLQYLFGDRYALGPLAVLCKPEHGQKILGGHSSGFSPQAAYIFLKQLEEADLLVLNKIDRLSVTQQDELLNLLSTRFPSKRIFATSSVTGAGYPELIEALNNPPQSKDGTLELDYDTYTAGEAALGWLNASTKFTSSTNGWSMDTLAVALVHDFQKVLTDAHMEPGHVKVLASADSAMSIANWVASEEPVELSVAANLDVSSADVLINVRVHGNPDTLAKLVKQSLETVANQQQLDLQISNWQHFQPGAPEPVHRFATPTG